MYDRSDVDLPSPSVTLESYKREGTGAASVNRSFHPWAIMILRNFMVVEVGLNLSKREIREVRAVQKEEYCSDLKYALNVFLAKEVNVETHSKWIALTASDDGDSFCAPQKMFRRMQAISIH